MNILQSAFNKLNDMKIYKHVLDIQLRDGEVEVLLSNVNPRVFYELEGCEYSEGYRWCDDYITHIKRGNNLRFIMIEFESDIAEGE